MKGLWHFFDMAHLIAHICSTLVLLLAVNLSVNSVFADPISVTVKLGFGRAQVVTVPPIDNTELQTIQTELLISEPLSQLVMAESNTEYHFIFESRVSAPQIEKQILANPSSSARHPHVYDDLPQRFFLGQTGRIEAGEKTGEVVVMGSDLEIYGEVIHLVAIGSQVKIMPGGKVLGSIESVGSHIDVVQGGQAPESFKGFEWDGLLREPFFEAASWFGRWEFWGIKFVVFLFIGLFFQRVFPEFHGRVETLIFEQFWAAWGWGFVAGALMLPGIFVLIMTILGIALIPFLIFFYFVGAIYGYAVLGLFVVRSLGQKVQFFANKPYGIRLVLGLVILQLVGVITGLSWFFVWFAALAGFGAFGVSLVKTLARRRKTGAAVAV